MTPRYDAEQIGVLLQGSPKHADILLVTGALTKRTHARPSWTSTRRCRAPRRSWPSARARRAGTCTTGAPWWRPRGQGHPRRRLGARVSAPAAAHLGGRRPGGAPFGRGRTASQRNTAGRPGAPDMLSTRWQYAFAVSVWPGLLGARRSDGFTCGSRASSARGCRGDRVRPSTSRSSISSSCSARRRWCPRRHQPRPLRALPIASLAATTLALAIIARARQSPSAPSRATWCSCSTSSKCRCSATCWPATSRARSTAR